MADKRHSRDRGWRRLLVIGVPLAVALAVVAWIALRANAATGTGDYATATVSRGDVDQELSVSGTVGEQHQASVGFPASGTVQSLNVSVGDHVTAGEKLATMNTDDLDLAVTQAKADLASAKAELETAQEQADSTGTTGSASATSPSPIATASPGTVPSNRASAGSPAGNAGSGSGSKTDERHSGAPPGPASKQLKKLQQQVARDTAALEQATTAAAQTFAAQQQACAFLGVPGPTSAPDSPQRPPGRTKLPNGGDHPADYPLPAPATSSPTESATPSATPTAPATPTPTPTPTPSLTPTRSAKPTPSPTPTATSPTRPTPTASPTAPSSSASQPSGEARLSACTRAVAQTVVAQRTLSEQQQSLSAGLTALATAISTAEQASTGGAGTPGSTGPTSTGGGSAANGSVGTGSNTSGPNTSGPNTSGSNTSGSNTSGSNTSGSNGTGARGTGAGSTVAEAEAAVETAKINLDLAKKQLKAATITSPIDGVIARIDFAAGDQVSTGDKIVITGSSAATLTVEVTQSQLPDVNVGQTATVGTNGAVGRVSAIGLLPTSGGDGSDASYPVTITVAKPTADLVDGSSANAEINIATARNVLRVPISAVTRSGKSGTVTVINNGTLTPTKVGIGAVGSTMIEITSGLSAGQRVVLADRAKALPTTGSDLGPGVTRPGRVQFNARPGG